MMQTPESEACRRRIQWSHPIRKLVGVGSLCLASISPPW